MNLSYDNAQPAAFFEQLDAYGQREFVELEAFLMANPGLDGIFTRGQGREVYIIEGVTLYFLYYIERNRIYVVEADKIHYDLDALLGESGYP